MPPTGLLYVAGDAGSNLSDAEFNDWYDNDHIPSRMAISSFRATSRWTSVRSDTGQNGGTDDDSGWPPYLAIYELDTCEVLSQAPYTTLAGRGSEREKDVMRRVALLDRRTYDLLEPEVVPRVAGYDAHHPGPYLVTRQFEVDPSLVDDLNTWYRDEHVPLLSQVPGWRRSRRYILRDVGPVQGSDAERVVAERGGRPPKYLALHEWESLDAFETPEYRRAASTPERMRLSGSAKVWDGKRWKLMKAWAQD